MKIVVIGGGAAAFFFAANAVHFDPSLEIVILEQAKDVLQKVRISGGGRCNVTHACFDPEALVEYYPRGGKELLGPFYAFGPEQTVEWYAQRGVRLKTEEDGRMFPTTDHSKTIIDCLMRATYRGKVELRKRSKVTNIRPIQGGAEGFWVDLLKADSLRADKVLVATGSSKQVWQMLEKLDLAIVSPVPSLFTFQISDPRLQGLAGISLPRAKVCIPDAGLESEGPLLITHKGLSGPAVLKLSAWGARFFYQCNYRADLVVDFCPEMSIKDLRRLRDAAGKKLVGNHQVLNLPRRLCATLLQEAAIDVQQKWASVSNRTIEQMAEALKKATFSIKGQNRFKEEFVTAGGVDLKEIDFSDFSTRRYPNLHLAGEVLNIDAVTGGFNFQAAWTGAFLVAAGISQA
ncbi:MAG: NAD(P)/FAD-dependent oxidoreductase [Bacteroidota bacterium]